MHAKIDLYPSDGRKRFDRLFVGRNIHYGDDDLSWKFRRKGEKNPYRMWKPCTQNLVNDVPVLRRLGFDLPVKINQTFGQVQFDFWRTLGQPIFN